MEIVDIQRYAGAYSDVCYTVECSTDGVLYEVVLMDGDSNIWGIKNLKGQRNHQVNVSGFARRELSVEPESESRTEWKRANGRVVSAKIEVRKLDSVLQTLTSPTTPLTASAEALDECKILSQRGARAQLSRGENDEIAIIASGKVVTGVVTLRNGDGETEILVGSTKGDYSGATKGFLCDEGEQVFVLSLDEIDPEGVYDHVSVEIKGGDAAEGVSETTPLTRDVVEQKMKSYGVINYKIVGGGAQDVRICWQNREGAVDYYTFRGEHGKRIIAEKSSSSSQSGQNVNSSLWQTETTLRSAVENKSTIAWLSQVVSSPRVWQVVEGGYEPIEVVTSELIVEDEQPVSVELKIRGQQKKQF